jgi:hypothetical protein
MARRSIRVAGPELFTSARILESERRLVATAGRTDGRTVDTVAVDLALLESAANGVTLDTGQAALVRSMATSGARLQLAIAPAGSGKQPHYARSHRLGWRAAVTCSD